MAEPIGPVITLKDVAVQLGGQRILNNINLQINNAENWAIIGGSGSGKTCLAHVLTETIFHSGSIDYSFPTVSKPHIELVEQQHHFKNLSNIGSFYYQQRFNSTEADDSHTVAEELKGLADPQNWIPMLHLEPLLNKPLLQLSNGENKRLQLAKALLKNPTLLILDNPFIGLDAEGRNTLHNIIDAINHKGISTLILSSAAELPASITHVAVLENGQLISAGPRREYENNNNKKHNSLPPLLIEKMAQYSPAASNFTWAIRMEQVHIRYGDKIILNNINWKVKKGECWSVSGPNGAGKSTLLSLINGDNPQAYANEIYLFDKKRGSGESIWDIKKQIGYVSPELHLYFDNGATGHDVIASGLFDTIGLFRKLSGTQEKLVSDWMDILHLKKFSEKRIFQLSTSEQRMLLLARALVKNPPLLILDEPCQGLDDQQSNYFKQLIDEICGSFSTTLVYVSHYKKDYPNCIQHFLSLKDGIQEH